MAEKGIVVAAGQPVMGAGSGFKVDFLPVGVAYQAVAAQKAASALGAGAIGDYLAGLVIVPSTISCGAVSIADGGGSAITVFAGGAPSLADLKPFYLPIGARSTSGGWSVTTNTAISVIAMGSF